ncbi:hypothetical protein Leryth_017168 [Lithospermum erythrorhizon]|uniref:Uncharacterized protein n=1 Tax=Lithospermum erythrorhizon TaxID=34254 RepID=A0AAV3NP68_LITER|nr:hypothetical protein Leryth_017168 [Lithospermum erythrorhizon]
MKTKAQVPQNRFLRIVTIPVRALVKAKDFYVRSMINCTSGVGYGGMGTVHVAQLPRSFSARSSMSNESEDFIELVRAASGKGTLSKLDLQMYLQQQMMMQNNKGVAGSRKMPRSASVAMGKIDEDAPFDFGEDIVEVNIKTQMKYPRSRSYAPTQRNSVF